MKENTAKNQKGPEIPALPGTEKQADPRRLYRIYATDLARDNLETDTPAADLEDL